VNTSFQRVALVWHGDASARENAVLSESRFRGVAEALDAVGLKAEPIVYNDDWSEEVLDSLLRVDGVLVWVNPIEQGRDRTKLDALLREVAHKGVIVSAHPDTILKMGTKEVLYRTREMSWGCDTFLYSTLQEFYEQFPLRLKAGTARVVKQYRGNGGSGVWRVEKHLTDSGMVRVRHALRGCVEQEMSLEAFLAQCEIYFEGAGRLIDQPFQERLTEGMVRCYMAGDRVVGFGHQKVNALFPAPLGGSAEEAPQPGPRLYYPPTEGDFQPIKRKMETDWLAALCDTLCMEREDLPIIWDADLLLGAKDGCGEDTYVLCEINVSSVYPFPDSALEPLAQAIKARLSVREQGG
jgi:hypothetical protein